MRTIVLFVFWVELFAIAVQLVRLAWADYPRLIKFSRGQDCVALVLAAAIAICAAYVLWATG
jgi:hypothetical protein